VLTALLAIAGPGSLRAQEADTVGTRASLAVEGSLRLTRIRGETVRMGGVAALLNLGGRFSFGLAGWTMFSDLVVERPGGSLDFSFSYGGAIGELNLVDTGDVVYSARLLVGAGTGKLDLPVVGTEIEADNVGVLEPEGCVSFSPIPRVRMDAAVGYRIVFGVQDLPGVTAGDLRGPTARVSLRLRAF
jgi:hypothetical protein